MSRSSLFLNPKDIGIQKHSVLEVAEKMKHSERPIDDSLFEFGLLVTAVLEEETSISEITTERQSLKLKK